MTAEKPCAATLEKEVQRERHVLGGLDPVVGQRVAGADLDADVGSVQPAKRLLVGYVVAEEHGGGRALLVTQDVEGLTLVGLDHRELQHGLTLGDLGVPRLRGGVCLIQRLVGVCRFGVAHMQSDAGRLDLDRDTGILGCDRGERVFDLAQQRLCALVDAVHETGVELRAVASDEVHLGGHARERGQIAQCPPGDQRGDRRRKRRQLAHRRRGFGEWPRIVGVGDDRRHRAVVVAGDEDTGNPSDCRERALQLSR